MKIWLNAHLSPAIAKWITEIFSIECVAVRELDLRNADDIDIFTAARDAEAIVITKDSDFVDLVERLGTPPQVIWLTCGNTSNRRLKEIFSQHLASAITLLESGEKIVEISG